MRREKAKDGSTMLTGLTLSDILLAVHPVGEIYVNITGTNPGTQFGGTWVAWGTGRVPVGVDVSQTEFDTVEEIGGQKQHNHNGVDHLHGTAGITANTGGFSYPTGVGYAAGTNQGTSRGAMDGHVHSMSHGHGSTGAADRSLTSGNANQLTGTQGPGLPPYITCYMWKRTA